MGNLTRDPNLKYLPSQTAVVEFGIACNRKYRTSGGEDREDVVFVDCAAFGKTGEAINQYLVKGKPIFIEGRLKYDSWEDKNGGGKRNKLSIIVDQFQFIGGRSDSDDSDQRQQSRPKAAAAAGSPFGNEQHFTEDDIPF